MVATGVEVTVTFGTVLQATSGNISIALKPSVHKNLFMALPPVFMFDATDVYYIHRSQISHIKQGCIFFQSKRSAFLSKRFGFYI